MIATVESAMQRLALHLPPFPWRWPVAAALVWMVLQAIPPGFWPPGLGPWIGTLDDLLGCYAVLQILAWLLVDLPCSVGLWQSPPRIIRDLTLLLIGTAITVVVVQQQVRINLISLVTASAVLTAVIGLAAQETLKDLFAGITLQLDPPFRLGDWVALGETRGVVTGFTLMNTELATLDGSKVVLPNSFVGGEQLRRLRPEDPQGIHFSIGLDYSYPPAQAVALLRQVLDNNAMVLRTPAAKVWVDHYGDSAIVYELLAYQRGSNNYALRDLRSALHQEIWYALQREGQSIPYPVRVLHPTRSRHAPDTRARQRQSLEQKVEALRCNALFQGLNSQQLQQLAGATTTQIFGPGEAVVVQGDRRDDNLYQVIAGTLEVSTTGEGAEEPIIVATLQPGGIFGEMSLLLDAPRSATVRACEEVELLQVDRSALAPLLNADPTLYEQLAAVVDRRQQQLRQAQLDQAKGPDLDILTRMKQLFGYRR